MRTTRANLAYAIGTVASPLLFQAIGAYLIFFYTDVVRLEVGLISLAYSLSYGIWNAINDPLVGHLSDRTRTRWGRRVPYIFIGAPLAALLFVAVWSPPVNGQPLAVPHDLWIFLYLAVTIGLFDLFFTSANISYASLFPEMFSDLKQRASVMIPRQIAAVVGLLLGLGAWPVLVKAFRAGAGEFGSRTVTAAVLGAIAWAAFWISLLGSRERREFSQEASLPLAQAFKVTFTNRTFLAAAVGTLVINYIWSWLAAMAPFFVKYILGAPDEQMSILFLAMFGTSIVFYPLWRWITLRIGSKRALVISVTLYALLIFPVLFISDFTLAILTFALLGAANAGITLVREIVLSDVIDEDELKTSLRREGVYFGVTTFVERFAMVLIGGSTALVLGLGRYQAGVYPQAEGTVLALRWGMFGLSILALAVFLIAMHFYPLGKTQVEEMRVRLEQLHQQKAAQLAGRE
jgi:GPH family glycoside/pentoside/hexuronide:cation symporter